MIPQRLSLIPVAEGEFSISPGTPASIVIGPRDSTIFWRVDVDDKKPWAIFIRHPDYHLDPSAYRLPNGNIAVGVLEHFYVVERLNIISQNKLPCRFYELIYIDKECAVVQHEVGFSCFTFCGNLIWDHTVDLIEEFRIEDEHIKYRTFEGVTGSMRIR